MWDPLSISAQIFTGEIVLGLSRKQSQKMWGVYNGMIYLSSSNLEPSPSTIDMCGITAAMDIVFAPVLPQPPPSPSTLVEINMLIPWFIAIDNQFRRQRVNSPSQMIAGSFFAQAECLVVTGVKDFVGMFHQHKESVNEKRAYVTSQYLY